ncbi:cystathionine gamma-synthase family protein [Reinekea sp.]|jgi:methionine-gamma-lyase|uniref:cystathionine gamma-synthase family protein n=1 Tax=Reinekea sp. TaxID=1970455 RepID=UPI00398954D3
MKKIINAKKYIGEHQLHPESMMMSYGYDSSLSEGSVKPPVFLTSTFNYPTAEAGEEFFHVASGRKPVPEGESAGLIYSRFNHPNVEIIEDRLALLEGSEEAVVCSSGMGAITATLLSVLRPGDVLMHSSPLYGGTEVLFRNIMTEFGIHLVEFHDGCSEQSMNEAVSQAKALGPIAMIFAESPGNPTNALVDIELMVRAASAIETNSGRRPVTAIDNTLMGPIFSQVVPKGIDLAVYSLTKYVGGHSDLIAGGVCGNADIIKAVRTIRNCMGINSDPHTCWMISRSLETLTIRMQREAESGLKVAQWLASNPYMSVKVLHPNLIEDEGYQSVYAKQCSGPGSTFSFVLDAPRADAFKFINALILFKSAVSLGGTESLVSHPASTTHSGVPEEVRRDVGIEEGLIRLSIGLEHPDDLIVDLSNGFKALS